MNNNYYCLAKKISRWRQLLIHSTVKQFFIFACRKRHFTDKKWVLSISETVFFTSRAMKMGLVRSTCAAEQILQATFANIEFIGVASNFSTTLSVTSRKYVVMFLSFSYANYRYYVTYGIKMNEIIFVQYENFLNFDSRYQWQNHLLTTFWLKINDIGISNAKRVEIDSWIHECTKIAMTIIWNRTIDFHDAK